MLGQQQCARSFAVEVSYGIQNLKLRSLRNGAVCISVDTPPKFMSAPTPVGDTEKGSKPIPQFVVPMSSRALQYSDSTKIPKFVQAAPKLAISYCRRPMLARR